MTGYVSLMRTEDTYEILGDPKAFTLLAGIAIRARWSSTGLSRYGLEPGQALLGDHKTFGLSPKEYRTAKARLEKWGLVAFKGTNKGTIATLLNTRVFDINIQIKGKQKGNPEATGGPSRGKPMATNENGNQKGKPCKPERREFRRIEIDDYGAFHDPNHSPIHLALTVGCDPPGGREERFFRNALDLIGDNKFRQIVSDVWGVSKSDNIINPGSILTNRLKDEMVKHGWRPHDE